jgi:hypothetical protein
MSTLANLFNPNELHAADPVVPAEPEPNRVLFTAENKLKVIADVRNVLWGKLRLELPYFLGGSAGLEQPAADIDIFVDGSNKNLNTLAEVLHENGYTSSNSARYSDSNFMSFRKGLINLILINDKESYTARQRAFEICKYLVHKMGVNLTKENRKMIHKIAAGEATA